MPKKVRKVKSRSSSTKKRGRPKMSPKQSTSVQKRKRRRSSPKQKPKQKQKGTKTSRHCFRRSKSKFPLVNRNLAKYVKEVNDEAKTCQIMTPHGHIIDLPDKYPGDDFVFENLYSNPEENMELVESELLREVYNKYHRMCF